MTRFLISIAICIVTIMFLSRCKKDSVSVTTTTTTVKSMPITDFQIQGNLQAGRYLSYIPNTTNSAYDVFWNFGDGDTSTVYAPVHAYLKSGLYTVTLTINDTQSITKSISIAANYSYTSVGSLKLGNTASFILFYPDSGDEYYWDFGDGDIVTTTMPGIDHIYTDTGHYTIKLKVKDSVVATSLLLVWAEPLYTNMLEGSRYWSGMHTTDIYGSNINSWTVTDSQISIHSVDAMHIIVSSVVFEYAPIESTPQVLVYANGLNKIWFDHARDSVWLFSTYDEQRYSTIGHPPPITHKYQLHSR